jgi:hypothetical protein
MMDKSIGELERSNMAYALQLFNIGFLSNDNPRYVDCGDIKEDINQHKITSLSRKDFL